PASADSPPSIIDWLNPSHPPERIKYGSGSLGVPLVGRHGLHGTSDDPADRSPQADEHLLRAAAADPSALGPLYDRYAKLVYGLALAILGSPEEAEELPQEGFVVVCQPAAVQPTPGARAPVPP